jgi:ParB/RepB/Spo0J family partition protein
MMVQQIALAKIKRDPNQVRQTKDPQGVADLAENIKVNGVINPIELSKDNTIITGESRYLAAQLAGLKTIPAIYRDIADGSKAGRQLSENLVRSGMLPTDIARAMKAEIDRRGCSMRQLALELGIQEKTVQTHIALLNVDAVLTQLADAGKIETRIAVLVSKISDKKVRDYMTEHVKNGVFASRTIITTIRDYLNATKNFKFVDELMSQSDKMTSDTFYKLVREETPSFARQMKSNLDKGQTLIMSMSDLAVLLERTKFEDISPIHYGRLLSTYSLLSQHINNFDKQLTLANPKTDEHIRIQAAA